MKATATLVLAAALGFGLAYSLHSAPVAAQGFPSSTFGGSGSLNRPNTDATLKSLSASTVTASTSIQTPDIKGAGGADRILLPSGDTTTIKGGTNAANYVTVTGTASGNAPTIASAGSDSNIGLALSPKGVGGLLLGNKVTRYNNVATAGFGVSPIYAYGTVVTTTDGTTVTTFTPSAQGLFEVGCHMEVTAWTSGNVGCTYSYTDCQGVAHSGALMWGESSTASNLQVLAATGVLSHYPQTLCANAAPITIKSSIAVTATASYWAFIRQVN